MQNTKRSLLISVTALLLCFVMLIGTTFAWFTDQATSANNIIKAGTLDIAMSWSEDNSAWNDTEGAGAKPVFDYDDWEPGYTEVRYIKVQNLGSLAFKYKMAINPTGAVGKLAEVIDVSFDIVTNNASFVAPTADNKQGSLTKVATLKQLIDGDAIVAGGVLLPDGETAANYYSGEIVICVSFHMQETAGNEYQGASIGDAFGINLYATQYDYESDSFDNSYDNNATWPNIENGAASTSIDASNLLLGALTSEVVINGDGIGATIPADVKVADGATSLNLTVESATADANISLGDGGSAAGFNVHIEGIAPDNTKPMIVNLGAILSPALNETELKLYHTENGTPTLMTRVNSASDFAIHNQYTYNPATGEVSIYVASFSIFSAVKTGTSKYPTSGTITADQSWYKANQTEFVLNDYSDFLGFRNLVDAGTTFEGKTVKLGIDIDLNKVNFDPIGKGYESATNKSVFKGTFDGQGHAIYNLYQNGWDKNDCGNTYSYSTDGGGLFASVVDANIKNLTICGANITMECIDMGILVGYAYGTCNFENIIITDSKIANYNRYTGGVVGEVNGTHTFNNIIVDSNVKISALWGTFDPAIGGVIGGKYGDATVSMTNVTVGAELDVFSDVTAAYQWYAYRRCGMLIGNTEMSDPNNAHLAYAPFLTCENVKVYYGGWVNYTYYLYDNQTDAEGNRLWNSNYPWVRAEKGEHNAAFSNARYGNPVIEGVTIKDGSQNSGIVEIPFNQLYGGGQGVYGQANHKGVTITKKFTNTIYFQNNFKWDDIKLYYWYEDVNSGEIQTWINTTFPGEKMELVGYDGSYEYYKFELPAYVDGFIISGEKNDGTGTREQTCDISAVGLTDGVMFSAEFVKEGQALNANKSTFDASKISTGYKQLYFKPSADWYTDSAWFAVYAFKDGSGNKWYKLSDKYSGGVYKVWVSTTYNEVILCRMNSSNTTWLNFGNVWNQTEDLAIPSDSKNLFTQNSGWSNTGSWSKKS